MYVGLVLSGVNGGMSGMMQGGSSASGVGIHTHTGVPYSFDPLFIEDPLALGNNVGRNCFRSVLTVIIRNAKDDHR